MKIRRLLLLFFLAFFLSASFFWRELQGPGKTRGTERFVVKQEFSEEEVIEDLKAKGFLKNKFLFKLILDLKNWHGRIEPGAYLISKSMNLYGLVKTLVKGPYQKWVVIPPGKRKEQTALIVQKVLGWPENQTADFINIAEEGYLYPDTYLVDVKATPQQVFQKLKLNFNEKFGPKLQEDLLNQNIRNDTALKIASLIERESGGDEDKPIIAGIIWNRLLEGMKLEIDATVQYALANQKLLTSSTYPLSPNFDFWPKVTGKDLRTTDSFYNAYLHKGLPPGPICSPGIKSIEAVAYPAQTKAFYYLHSPDKKIHTAETYKEHQENIDRYLR